jgi:hypothetical protein
MRYKCIKKTKIIIINKENTQNLPVNINVDGIDLELVKDYSYRGHITSDGKCEKEINKRIKIAINIFTKIKHIQVSKQLSNKLKLRVINCYIYSTFIYGAETWTFDKKAEKKIDDLKMWKYRRMRQIVWSKKENKQ